MLAEGGNSVETKEFIKALSEETGVSGHEARVAKIAARVLGEYADEVTTDALGNVIALKRGEGAEPRPRIMLAAHMDEIGLIVTKIEDSGFIRFAQVGGVDQRLLPALEVIVHGQKDLEGVVGVKPPHLTAPEEVEKAI
jgi:endoglucanase